MTLGLKSESPPAATKVKSTKDDPRFSLKGNTLRVYMHILRGNGDSIGVREVQRELGLSSPTLAKYHLERLQAMGLLKLNEDDGTYSLLKEVRVDVLQPFVTVGSVIIPRLFTYAILISVLFAYLVAFVLPSGNLPETDFFSVAIGFISLFALWFETARSWHNIPH